jgi:hypothetical protein
VRKLHRRLLEHSTIDVFLDEIDLRYGQVLGPSLERSIAHSDWLLIVLSQNSVRSRWVDWELATSRKHQVPVLPLRIDGSEIPLALREVVSADATTSFELAVERVVCTLTGSPVLPFLTDPSATPVITAQVRQIEGKKGGERCAKLSLKHVPESTHAVESLSLTTLAYWPMEQREASTSPEPITTPDGRAVEIHPAAGSRVLVKLDLHSAEGADCTLFTRHDAGNGLGNYVYLLGAEVTFKDLTSQSVGLLLVDLHGKRVLGYTRWQNSRETYDSVVQTAAEILRIAPKSTIIDAELHRSLKELAARLV